MSKESLSSGYLQPDFFATVMEVHALFMGNWSHDFDRLVELSNGAAAMVVDKVVRVVDISPHRNPYAIPTYGPITAYYEGYEDWARNERSTTERPDSMGLFTHPRTASGRAYGLDLQEATLRIRPRLWSPYRRHEGYFAVKLLDYGGKPAVDLKVRRGLDMPKC